MYIITSKTRSRMKRNPVDYAKMKEDLKHKCQERGLATLVPLNGQDIDKMSKDIDKAGSFFKEEMEKKRKKRKEMKLNKFLETQPQRMKEAPSKYAKMKNRNKK